MQTAPLSSDDWSSAISPPPTLVLDYNRHATTKHLGSRLSSTKLGRWWGYFPRGGESEERQSITLYSFAVGPNGNIAGKAQHQSKCIYPRTTNSSPRFHRWCAHHKTKP